MRRLITVLVSAALLLAAGAATALPLTVTPNPLDWSVGTASGTLDFIGYSVGQPSGGTDLSGSTGGSDDVLIFQVNVDAGTLAAITLSTFTFPPPAGPTAGGEIDTGDVGVLDVTGTTSKKFTFDGGVGAGESSNQIYIAWANAITGNNVGVATFDSGPTNTLNFTISEVPEPATLMLLGGGLAALAASRRRPSRP